MTPLVYKSFLTPDYNYQVERHPFFYIRGCTSCEVRHPCFCQISKGQQQKLRLRMDSGDGWITWIQIHCPQKVGMISIDFLLLVFDHPCSKSIFFWKGHILSKCSCWMDMNQSGSSLQLQVNIQKSWKNMNETIT